GGCYMSSTPLGGVENGTLDDTLTGTWQCKDPSEGSTNAASLTVMAFDSRQYYAEWREDEKISRYAAYSTEVHGIRLFNVHELKGTPKTTEWLFLRARRAGKDRLELSVVKDDALKDLREPEALRQIKQRARDEALYGLWASCTLER